MHCQNIENKTCKICASNQYVFTYEKVVFCRKRLHGSVLYDRIAIK